MGNIFNMKFYTIRNSLLLILLLGQVMNHAQNIIVDTLNPTIIVKDSAKVGIIIASKGNTINVAQNIGRDPSLNKKISAEQLNNSEKFEFEISKKYFSWGCNFDDKATRKEIAFYFENDSLIDSFSRIIIQLEQFSNDTSKILLREFYLPQMGENFIVVPLRNVTPPYKISCGIILKNDEKKTLKKVYTQQCIQMN